MRQQERASNFSRRKAKEAETGRACERGFTLIETSIALVIMMIVAMGAASLFVYSISNNSGGNDRAVAIALAQQQMETLRNASFSTSGGTSALLAGGTTSTTIDTTGASPCAANQRCYSVSTVIDDNPATPAVDVNAATTLKGITVTVTAQGAGPAWATGGGVPVTLLTLRAKA